MEIVDNIVERLPEFYRARERGSYIYEFVSGFAKIISEQKKELLRIRDSHWIDSSDGISLDLLASIFGLGRKRKETDEEFRLRISSTIADMRKGATVEAVRTQLAQYLATSKEDIVVVEFPPTEMMVQKQVLSGDTWTMNSSSINSEKAAISLFLEDGEAIDPTIIDTGANISIRYKGTLKKSDTLEIIEGKGLLNGNDVTTSLTFEKSEKPVVEADDFPNVSRKPSKWIFREKITDTHGRFDQSKFNENVFFKLVPPITLTIKWTAHLLGSFEVRIAPTVLEKSDMTKEEIEELVNAIKAAGIQSSVTIMSDNKEMSTIETKQPEPPNPAQTAGR